MVLSCCSHIQQRSFREKLLLIWGYNKVNFGLSVDWDYPSKWQGRFNTIGSSNHISSRNTIGTLDNPSRTMSCCLPDLSGTIPCSLWLIPCFTLRIKHPKFKSVFNCTYWAQRSSYLAATGVKGRTEDRATHVPTGRPGRCPLKMGLEPSFCVLFPDYPRRPTQTFSILALIS